MPGDLYLEGGSILGAGPGEEGGACQAAWPRRGRRNFSRSRTGSTSRTGSMSRSRCGVGYGVGVGVGVGVTAS